MMAAQDELHGQPIEVLYGVNVVDPPGYAEYRAQMAPLLAAHGGGFVVDVWVSEVLRAPIAVSFNRLFTIRFPSPAAKQAFFTDPGYLAIRARLFTPSVSAVAELGDYVVLSS